MTLPFLPMPNERFLSQIVVASTWLRDDTSDEPLTCLVLLLRPGSPYFCVSELVWKKDRWLTVYENLHYNIVPAVHDYEQCGGDY